LLLAIKLLWFVLFVRGFAETGRVYGEGVWGHRGLDSHAYLMPIENKLAHDRFTFDLSYPPSAYGRLPGMAVTYGLVRLVLPKKEAGNAYLLLSVVVSTVALFLLARALLQTTGSPIVYWSALGALAVSGNIHVWDAFTMSESMATSFLALTLTFLLSSPQRVFAAGLALAAAIFFRPILLPLTVLLAALVIVQPNRWAVQAQPIRRLAFYFLPLVICLTAWTARNWIYYDVWAPFQTRDAGYSVLDPKKPTVHLFDYIMTWGGELDFLQNTQAPLGWFLHPIAPEEDTTALPSYLQAAVCAPDVPAKLWKLRRWMAADYQDSTAHEPNLARHDSIIRLANALREQYKAEQPVAAHLLAPLRLIRSHVTKNPVFYYPGWDHPALVVMKRMNQLLYVALLILIVLIVARFRVRMTTPVLMVMVLALIYLLISAPVLARFTEARYLVLAYMWVIPTVLLAAKPSLLHRTASAGANE